MSMYILSILRYNIVSIYIFIIINLLNKSTITLKNRETVFKIMLNGLLMGTILFLFNEYQLNNIFLRISTYIICFIIFLKFMFKNSLIASLQAAGYYLFLSFLADVLNFLIYIKQLNFTSNYIQHNIVMSIFADFTLFILFIIFIFIYTNRKKFKSNIKYIYIALLIGIMLSSLIFNSKFANNILFIFIVVISLLYIFINLAFDEQDKENITLKKYIETIEKLSQELRLFRHDYLNILASIKGYMINKDYENLESFIDNLLSSSDKIKFNQLFSLQKIKHSALLGLINAKIEYCNIYNIVLNLTISGDITKINMKDIDLIKVIGNFLDNSIDAVKNLKNNKIIMMEIIDEKEYITIKIKNEFIKINQDLSTTKGNQHGNGLVICKKIISEYNNIINNRIIDNNIFIQELIIKK